MRKIVIIGLAAGILAAPLPAQATDTNANRSEAAREQSQSAGNNARERQICVREAGSETRIRRTICHTEREWRYLQANDEIEGR